MGKIKICYCAIFKNESKNVYRCLNALKSIIDCVSICDTGSTDNTIELVEKWGKENQISTAVHTGEKQIFKNFAYNRTQSFIEASKRFPSADYFLLVDADMVIKIESTFDKEKLTADCYMIKQKSNSQTYSNLRLLSNKFKWRCICRTHEYWEAKTKKDYITGTLDTLWIDDIGDGGAKDDKFVRDIRLLTEGIEKPEYDYEFEDGVQSRYRFYLANSYKDSVWGISNPEKIKKIYQNAIKWYRNKLEYKGKNGDFVSWGEEIFYCYYNIGECYENLEDIPNAIYNYLLAWDSRPTRAESLYKVIKIYREQEQQRLAMLYADKAIGIEYPKDDRLFIKHNVYDYLIWEEISICAYYTKENVKGKKACLMLLKYKDKLSEKKYQLLVSNAKFYGLDIEKIVSAIKEK